MKENDASPFVETILYLDEPQLEFGEGQAAVDPHDGLALFGPYSRKQRNTPVYMLIGAPESAQAFSRWSKAMNGSATIADVKKQRLWPPFPGYEVAFGDPWAEEPAVTYGLDRASLIEASQKRDPHERCFAVVEKVLSGFEKRARKEDSKVDVAICVIPDDVWKNCRPESHVVNATGSGMTKGTKDLRKAGQRELFDEFNVEQYSLSPRFSPATEGSLNGV